MKRKKQSSSSDSRISTYDMQRIVKNLLNVQHRSSTAKNYLSIWRKFNKFIISLDVKPDLWEDRATLFLGYLISNGIQSSTIKSYLSAIKKTLMMDGYNGNDKLVLVRSLVKACRIINEQVRTRLPIHCNLLEMLLFEVQRHFTRKHQYYLESMYKAIFAISYYGLMRIGEVTSSPHVLKANNVHIGINKDKIMLVLYSSKTHDKAQRPQKIKITSNGNEKSGHYKDKYFCPFKLMRDYIQLRGGWTEESEQFFIFKDGSLVSASQLRSVFNLLISNLGLECKFYGMHSFRIGRTSDLIKFDYPVEQVKLMGRWKSNVIYKYIRA